MNIVIAGAGEVGGHAAEVLSGDNHNVTVIDIHAGRLDALKDELDLRTLTGHCTHLNVLQDAGVANADLFVAATQVDEINLLSAFMAKECGAKKTIVRVHHTANFSLRRTDYASRLGIDEFLCPEHLTSLAIARMLRNPGSIALEEFGRGKLLMQRFPVDDGAPAAGKKLIDLALPENARVATVESGDSASIASAATVVAGGDFVTLIGKDVKFDQARKLFSKGKEKRQVIVIMGETSTAVWLGRALRSRVFSVRLFVNNRARAEELAEKLPHVTILEGDPTDVEVFLDEHIEKADAFIAVAQDDEHNVLACGQAKALGVKSAIAVVQRAKYLHLFEHVGIDQAFSPRVVAVNAIQHLIDVGRVRTLASIADGVASVYEVHPSSRCNVLEHELRNIDLPAQTMIAALHRGEDVFVPGADDKIMIDDRLLVIGPIGINKSLEKIFVTS